MLEAFIGGLIAFAGGYVLIMRTMARSADVLHGEFIQTDGPNSIEPSWSKTLLTSLRQAWTARSSKSSSKPSPQARPVFPARRVVKPAGSKV